MATNSELVSRIKNDIRTLNKDEHISKRYILTVLRNNASFLISQKLGERSLYKDDSLYSTLSCFPMYRLKSVDCDILEFKRCNKIMKSVHKLPSLISSKYGSSVLNVTTVDGLNTFQFITPRKYTLERNRRYSDLVNSKFYYIKSNYLYLLDTTIELVDLDILTLENESIAELSDCNSSNGCESIWDYDFICPDKLLEAVVKASLQEIISTYRQIQVDENPNMDEGQRGSTTV